MVSIFEAPDGSFRITKREVSDDADSTPDLEGTDVATLFRELQKSPELRKSLDQLISRPCIPILFTDPKSPFNPLEALPQTGFLAPETLLILYKGDGVDSVAAVQLVETLVRLNFLREDKYVLVYCDKDSCKQYSIGCGDTAKPKKSFCCVKCGTPAAPKGANRRVTKIYSLKPEARDVLLSGRGKILEGLVYQALASEGRITDRFEVIPGAQLVSRDNGADETHQGEKDIFLIDREKKMLPIAVLVSLAGNSAPEKKQVEHCVKHGIKTIFVSTRGVSDSSDISKQSWKVYQNANSDASFPSSLIEDILTKLVPELESRQQLELHIASLS